MPRPIRAPYAIPSGAEFGALRQGGRHHQGTDYHCPIGTLIYATGDGRVVSNVGETGVGIGFGNYVSIAYLGNRVTLDGHLRERSPLAIGTIVNSSTVVGIVGISGNAIYADPPGAHDHHQVWLNGDLTDPAAYYGTDTADSGSTPIGEDMPLDATDKEFINTALAYVVRQIAGTDEYEKNPLTIKAVRDDIGYRDSVLAAIRAAIPTAGGTVDLDPILAELKALPAETVAAIKSAL